MDVQPDTPSPSAAGNARVNRRRRSARLPRWLAILDRSNLGVHWVSLAAVLLVLIWCGWRVINDTTAFTAARVDPEGALSAQANSPEALVALAEQRLVAATSSAEIDEAANFAKAALISNPLEERAVRVLAFAADLKGDDDRAKELMRSASERSRRDEAVQAWLFNQAIAGGDIGGALDHADALFRINLKPDDDVLHTLARLVTEEKARPIIANRLATGVPWRPALLNTLSAEIDPAIVYAFFDELGQGPRPPDTTELRPFLETLINRRNYDLAYLVWLHFLPPERRQMLSYVYNGDFELPISQLPFDWTYRDPPGARTGIVVLPDAGIGHALRVEFADTRVDYHNLSKLLMLTPGRYVFGGMVKADQLETERGLIWRIACAGSGAKIGETPAVKGTFAWRSFSLAFDVPEENCRAQTLTLALDARVALDQQIGGEIWFDNLAVERQ
jgi:hypothetical protein